MIAVGVAAFALVMVVAYLVTKPFLAPDIDGARSAQLVDDRARALGQLRDLEMEVETGKLSDDEYQALRSHRLEEIRALDARLAELAAAPSADPGAARRDQEPATIVSGEAPRSDDDVERRIAARRHALETERCRRCETDVRTADRFCRSCGTPLDAAEAR